MTGPVAADPPYWNDERKITLWERLGVENKDASKYIREFFEKQGLGDPHTMADFDDQALKLLFNTAIREKDSHHKPGMAEAAEARWHGRLRRA